MDRALRYDNGDPEGLADDRQRDHGLARIASDPALSDRPVIEYCDNDKSTGARPGPGIKPC